MNAATPQWTSGTHDDPAAPTALALLVVYADGSVDVPDESALRWLRASLPAPFTLASLEGLLAPEDLEALRADLDAVSLARDHAVQRTVRARAGGLTLRARVATLRRRGAVATLLLSDERRRGSGTAGAGPAAGERALRWSR
ncbi:MAG: hypothetical protein R3A48_27855 [Polyangiales bacterium]